MGLTRRRFLQWAGATGIGAVVFNGCRVPDHEIEVQSPLQLPEDLVTGRDNFYATVAQSSAGSEGLLVRVMEGRAKKVEGNPDYPLNTGKHGLRAEALLQAAYHPDRIKTPLVRTAKEGPFQPIDWSGPGGAIERLAAILRDADPSRVVLATGPVRGKLADVTRRFADAYGARLMGFDPVDQTVLRAAMKRVFDQDVLPDFDIARTGYLLSFGSDFLGTWLDPTHFARGYGEFRQGAGRNRGFLVQVDSRFSATAAVADRWVYVSPGSEGLLAMAMAQVIVSEDRADPSAINGLTGGRGAAALSRFAPSTIASQVGMPAREIVELARDFSSRRYGQPLAIGGGSAGAHTNGLFNLTAIYALNYLVGAVDPPEGGGLVFNPTDLQSQVVAAPLREWKQVLEEMRSGRVDVLLVRDANLEYGLPGALNTRDALQQVGTIVSFSSFLDETTAMADLVLPGHTPLEEWGTDTPDPGPGYATVAFQQPVINRFRNTLAFGDALLQVGRELGLQESLPWDSMREAVRDTARELHETGRGSVTQPTFEEFWKRALERGGWWDMNQQVSARPAPKPLPSAPQRPTLSGTPNAYPFFLVPYEGHGVGTGQFAHLPWAQAAPDPVTTVTWATWVDLNPRTAQSLGLKLDDVVILESPTGRVIKAAVYINPATPPNVAAVPFGQGHRHFTGVAARRGANVLEIVAPQEDEETGALAWAGTRVRLVKTRDRQALPKLEGQETAVQLPGEEIIQVQRLRGA